MMDPLVTQSVPTFVPEAPPKDPAEVLARYRSPLRYPGGKQKAIDQIATMLPSRAREFREPLVGGGAVYFHAKSVEFAESYWVNDAFQELMTFWSIVQDPDLCQKLMKELETLRANFGSAAEIKEYFIKARDQKTRTKFREAFLFFFFNRVTFSGTTKAGGFSAAASEKDLLLHRLRDCGRCPKRWRAQRLQLWISPL